MENDIDVSGLVCAPLVGGALVGQWVAREMGSLFAYAERIPESSGGGSRYVIPHELRGGVAGRKIVIVDDAVNAGSATLACAREVESLGGKPVALAGLIVRESAIPDLRRRIGVPVEALVAVRWSLWAQADCPLCRSGAPLDHVP